MLYNNIQESIQYIRKITEFEPKHGIILGTGLGNLTDDIDIVAEIDYKDIPYFPISTVDSHKGKLIFGYLEKIPVVVMAGRFHYYEGYSMKQVTFPVRVLKFLGIQRLIISNLAGSTSQHIIAGDIVFIKDHINLMPENPLRGVNDERLGPRFPDMLKAYDHELIEKAMEIAAKQGIRTHTGVYVGFQGPNLETPSEYQFLHRIGGDVVGMSTVPEVLVAKHSGLDIFVLSVISNQSYPPSAMRELSLEEVIEIANEASPKMRYIVKEVLKVIS